MHKYGKYTHMQNMHTYDPIFICLDYDIPEKK